MTCASTSIRTYWNTLVIVISSMTEIQYAMDAMRKGAFDYLLKPVNVSQLFESIERALSYQQILMASITASNRSRGSAGFEIAK